MINKTGKNIDVLIASKVSTDWATFAAWYSVMKKLPSAKVTIACMRTGETPYQLFQWVRRIQNTNFIKYKKFSESETSNKLSVLNSLQQSGTIGENILLLDPYMMVLDVLNEEMIDILSKGISFRETTDLFNNSMLEEEKILKEIHPIFSLWREAKETDSVWPVINYKKGVGKWIHTARGCPFSNAAGLVSEEMTINEHRIIDLWKKMTPLFSVVS